MKLINRITKNSDECFPGITEPYEISKDAELILNTEEYSIEECNRILLEKVKNFIKLDN